MDRAGAATFIATRYGHYLSTVGRATTDGVADPDLGPVIDDALRRLGVEEADLGTAEAGSDEVAAYQAILRYVALQQIVADAGGQLFDVSTAGDSFRLNQVSKSAGADLDRAEADLARRFPWALTTPGAGSAEASPFVTLVTTDACAEDEDAES